MVAIVEKKVAKCLVELVKTMGFANHTYVCKAIVIKSIIF